MLRSFINGTLGLLPIPPRQPRPAAAPDVDKKPAVSLQQRRELSAAQISFLFSHAVVAAILNGIINGFLPFALVSRFGEERSGVTACLRIPPVTNFIGNEHCVWWDATLDLLFTLFTFTAIFVPLCRCSADRSIFATRQVEPLSFDILQDSTLRALSCLQSFLLWLTVCVLLWLVSCGLIFMSLGVSRSDHVESFRIFAIIKAVHSFVWSIPITLMASWIGLLKASEEALRSADVEAFDALL